MHVRLTYRPGPSPHQVTIDVATGPRFDRTTRRGTLVLPAPEANALDRLLTFGCAFDKPTTTYEIAKHTEGPAAPAQ